MKKVLSIFIIVSLIFTLCACSGDKRQSENNSSQTEENSFVSDSQETATDSIVEDSKKPINSSPQQSSSKVNTTTSPQQSSSKQQVTSKVNTSSITSSKVESKPSIENTDKETINNKPNGSTKGAVFSDAHENSTVKTLATPTTYEAWIKCRAGYTGRVGVILGNYDDSSVQKNDYFSFEIYTKGNPSLYYRSKNGEEERVTFNSVNVCTGEWVHLAIVNDHANGKAYCYINGKLAQKKLAIEPVKKLGTAMVGNDYRDNDKISFKGEIHSIAVYDNARTQEEIKKDVNNYGKEGLIAGWILSDIPANGKIIDISGKGNHINWMWIKEKATVKNFDYSFVLVGDTQSVNIYDPNNFSKIYDWIVKNKTEKKIEYVMGLGDITDKDQDAEWQRAETEFKKLENAGISYSVVRGNHDSSNKFNKVLKNTKYMKSYDGRYGNTLENTYRKIEVNGIKYLIFTLDFGATDDVLDWASKIIEIYSNYNVIITTHSYLYRDGTTLDANDVCPPTVYGSQHNNGDHMWDELISKHKNIVLVVSGHDPYPSVICTQTKGKNNNVVTQLLTDHQYVDRDLYNKGMDTTGMVTILHFSEDGSKVAVECYSTVYDMYFGHENQFEFTLNVIK